MHIITIVCDTLRRDFLGCYGNDWVQTPHIDALARSSLVFDSAYAGSFPTIPHRADLMTGRYVFHTTGWAPLPPGSTRVQEYLRRNGYVTQLISDHIQFLGPGMNYHAGFMGQQWVRGHQGDPFTTDDEPVEWPCDPAKIRQPEQLLAPHLRNRKGRRFEREWHDPATISLALDWLEHNYRHAHFHLHLGLFGTHEPWDPPRFYRDLYDPGYDGEEVILPRYDFAGYLTAAEIRHVRALYAGMITMLDRWLGRLVESLKLQRLWDKTAILLTSDHGWYHGEHGRMGKHTVLKPKEGWPLYEEVAHVPLMLRVPGLAEGGRHGVLVQPVDLMPTLLELGGVEIPSDLHGRSIVPVLHGGATRIRTLAVSSPTLPVDPDVQVYSTATDGTWTLIDGGRAAPSELYRVTEDPRQERNVISSYPDQARELHNAYVAFLRQIGTSEDKLALRTWAS